MIVAGLVVAIALIVGAVVAMATFVPVLRAPVFSAAAPAGTETMQPSPLVARSNGPAHPCPTGEAGEAGGRAAGPDASARCRRRRHPRRQPGRRDHDRSR